MNENIDEEKESFNFVVEEHKRKQNKTRKKEN